MVYASLPHELPNDFFVDGRAFMSTQEKKVLGSSKLGHISKVLKFQRVIAYCPVLYC